MGSRSVAVVGLGYVGLPVAVLAAKKGYAVFGYDVVAEKVELINNGKSPIEDAILEKELAGRPIVASMSPDIISKADVIIVTVPTPVTQAKEPDLEPLKIALSSILPHLRSGQLLSVESTINPGVMDEVVLPILRGRDDLVLENDLYVVHCPERINPGDKNWTIETISRVIGGYSSKGTQLGKEFYESILDAPVKVMGSVTEAEAVKIFENTFRDVNIAFVNEMAKSFDVLGIDVLRVIEGAATKPFAFMAHYPGNGVGGHCISVDPYYMIERARQAGFDHKFLKLARTINDSMPGYVVDRMKRAVADLGITKPVTVALLGLAYKKNIDDIRESPAIEIRHLLEQEDITLRVFDPHVMSASTVTTLAEALAGADVVMLACAHDEFTSVLTGDVLKKYGVKLVVDGRNALDTDSIAAAGISYVGVGRSRSVFPPGASGVSS